MMAKTIHQCPACERGYASREQARSCVCPDRTIEKWECPACGNWWEPKWRTVCCGKNRDGSEPAPPAGAYCAKLAGPCLDGCPAHQVACSDRLHGDCWRVKPPHFVMPPPAKAR
jgi:hypothetical protein